MKTIKEINEMVEALMSQLSSDESYPMAWHDLCDIKYELVPHEEKLENPTPN